MPNVGTVYRGPKVICAVQTAQKALKHTNTCVGYIAVEAYETVWQRHANRGGSRTKVKRACVCVNVDGLDHMRCKYKSGGIYMPNMCKKRNCFVDSRPEVRVRCSE